MIATDEPVQELAAEPATLARIGQLLDRARERPEPGRMLPGGLLALPRVEDLTVPPLTVYLRPYSTLAPEGPTS